MSSSSKVVRAKVVRAKDRTYEVNTRTFRKRAHMVQHANGSRKPVHGRVKVTALFSHIEELGIHLLCDDGDEMAPERIDPGPLFA